MKNKFYAVPVHVNGVFLTKVVANNIEDAYNKTNELTENADFGALQNIDWDVGKPVPFNESVHDVSDGGDGTLNDPKDRIRSLIESMISFAKKAWECGDEICRLTSEDNDGLFDILTEIQECSLTDPNEAFDAIMEAVEDE